MPSLLNSKTDMAITTRVSSNNWRTPGPLSTIEDLVAVKFNMRIVYQTRPTICITYDCPDLSLLIRDPNWPKASPFSELAG